MVRQVKAMGSVVFRITQVAADEHSKDGFSFSKLTYLNMKRVTYA